MSAPSRGEKRSAKQIDVVQGGSRLGGRRIADTLVDQHEPRPETTDDFPSVPPRADCLPGAPLEFSRERRDRPPLERVAGRGCAEISGRTPERNSCSSATVANGAAEIVRAAVGHQAPKPKEDVASGRGTVFERVPAAVWKPGA